MKRGLLIFYVVALALHAGVLFFFRPPAPSPPKKVIDETFVDVALTRPSEPEPPKSVVVSQLPPKIETAPPMPEEKIEPPPPIKPEMTVSEPQPQPPSSPPPKPVITPPPVRSKDEYIPVSEPKYAERVEPVYPEQARLRHQQGSVVLALFINESGVLDRVEVVKSSGFPLLDNAAIKAVKQSQFVPALENAVQVRSQAEVTVAFKLQ